MITVTLGNLVLLAQSGAYQRFSAIRKTITAGHKNRKVPAAIQEELKQYDAARLKLAEQCGGVMSEDKSHYTFGEKVEEFTKGVEELLAQMVELPGEPMKLADLLDGGLTEGDYDLLAAFLIE